MSNTIQCEVLRVKDAASCREWLAQLPDDGQRLAAIERLLTNLSRSRQSPDQLLEIAEQARPHHLSAIATLLAHVHARPVPMPRADWQRMQSALASLRQGRDLYQHLHTLLVDGSGLSTRSVIPGAAESMRTVLPLGRAMDYEARRLAAALKLGVALEPAEWRDACTLAHHLRRSTFIDAALPDPVPLIRVATSRALFVYPLLLSLAQLERRSEHEVALVDRLAQRWSAKVGFRIDEDGLPHENRHGPTLQLDERLSIRLDTHKLVRSLQSRMTLLSSGDASDEVRLPRGMTLEHARRLLEALRECWSEAWRPMQMVAPPARHARVRFGVLPLRGAAPHETQATVDGSSTGVVNVGVASAAYVYGRFETNTIMRMALGAQQAERDPLDHLMADGQTAAWVGQAPSLSVFDVLVPTPALSLGTLVLVAAEPGEGGPVLAAGPIVSLQEAGDAQGGARRVRMGVALYDAAAELVGLRVDEQPFYEDVLLLSGDPASLLVPVGRWRAGAPGMMRQPDVDVRIVFERAIERGAGFERVRIRVLGP